MLLYSCHAKGFALSVFPSVQYGVGCIQSMTTTNDSTRSIYHCNCYRYNNWSINLYYHTGHISPQLEADLNQLINHLGAEVVLRPALYVDDPDHLPSAWDGGGRMWFQYRQTQLGPVAAVIVVDRDDIIMEAQRNSYNKLSWLFYHLEHDTTWFIYSQMGGGM